MKFFTKIKRRIIQWLSDCDGMCDFHEICEYCKTKENENSN